VYVGRYERVGLNDATWAWFCSEVYSSLSDDIPGQFLRIYVTPQALAIPNLLSIATDVFEGCKFSLVPVASCVQDVVVSAVLWSLRRLFDQDDDDDVEEEVANACTSSQLRQPEQGAWTSQTSQTPEEADQGEKCDGDGDEDDEDDQDEVYQPDQPDSLRSME
jgi:hypothetical protein